jgi:hypothetical protein
MPIAEAGITVCSLSIDNTTWSETRESCNDQPPPLSADKQFLVYGWNISSSSLSVACRDMNDGIGALNAMDDPTLEGCTEFRSIYIEGPLETDMDKIKAKHCQVARERGCSETMFAVADPNHYEKEGLLLVKLDEGVDGGMIRKDLPIAGEILNWVYLGLWDWHDACRTEI